MGGIWAKMCAIDGDHLCPPAVLPSGVSMGTEWTLCSAHAPYTRSQMRIRRIKEYMKTGTGQEFIEIIIVDICENVL